ncbi:DUF4180 domain-containing protein [Paenibacillus sp. OV219]|uniref:DUF4180 domain-containing protein n=1 Tax=Paenibacillus sp. OV219 TaxID=1884377 RepID=UPI0008D80D44|nr:DUF4180 domain-containing protein [Paenibacillus sp. OV219]SEN53214.1 protein of unknown function [Paenibacillus sp. OV219]
MDITLNLSSSSKVAIIESEDVVIGSVQDALDLMATVSYNYDGCYKILIHKSAVAEPFFDLSTKLAGDILQKFTNYKVNLAIVGDFSEYSSKSLKDFIYESNQGKQFFFLLDEMAALEALHNVR